MSNQRIWSVIVLAAAVAAWTPRAWAVGEQTARIRGVVTNSQSGELLEGVTVEADGSALIGGSRTTLTKP